MVPSNDLNFELTVIGSGMAGMAAALFAARRGLSTAIVGCSAQSIFASGFLDVLGVHPIAERKICTDPWAGIAALSADSPDHPYARLTTAEIGTGLHEFIAFLEDAGLSYRRRPNQNVMAVSPMGTLKPTHSLPESMWNGVTALENKEPCLIVGVAGLKGFSARMIAETLRPVWPGLRPVQITCPESGPKGELYTERLALKLELAEHREKFARCVQPHIKNARAVGLPAMVGLYRPREAYADLAQRIGVPLFEIPTMPPSVAGLRLKAVFEKRLPEMGVRTFFAQKILNARRRSDHGFILELGNAAGPHNIGSTAVILATGRFLGRGLHAGRKRIRETIFDLPVYQPGERAQWHRRKFFDPRGHRINQSGLQIDDHFRPLNTDGRPADPTLFAAGSILAHQDWMRQKCGSGLAIASAYAAVTSYLKMRG